MLTTCPSLDPATAFCHSPASQPNSTLPADASTSSFHLWGLEDLCWGPVADCSRKGKGDHPKPVLPPSDMEPPVEPEEDLQRLTENDLRLRLCGYYYGCLSSVEAARLLRRTPPGTFLVRDSEHACYLYSLSVQTPRGPTSCRIEYHAGRFRIDSTRILASKSPRFESVLDLVEHYMWVCQKLPQQGLVPVWLDMDENCLNVSFQIYRPLYKEVRSLQHLCRVTLVRSAGAQHPQTNRRRTLDEQYRFLPTVLRDYLREYPYTQ